MEDPVVGICSAGELPGIPRVISSQLIVLILFKIYLPFSQPMNESGTTTATVEQMRAKSEQQLRLLKAHGKAGLCT